MFHLSSNVELTSSILLDFIDKHRKEVSERYEGLKKAYTSDHDILHEPAKASYKPDNRIVVNFPKYIVDTMNGFFIGNPIKITADDKAVAERVEYLDQFNDQDDNNAELSKICSIYGKGYELYFADEKSELNITYFNPTEAFMIFDDSVLEKPLYFVRLYKDYNNKEFGCLYTKTYYRNFGLEGGFKWLDKKEKKHGFDDVPATEFIENEERQGIFEPVMSMVNAFNKAVSEKANDVDYFADSYLKVLGTKLEEDDIKHIRDNRIINFEGDVDTGKLIVEFMNKPESDTTQENHLNRLERLIFQISMVANISDENFGSSSGIALKYKLQAMSNLAKTKERKFTSGMNRRYKLLFSHPLSGVPDDAWVQLHYKFTPNYPANLLEEVQIAAGMEGITSHETQLKVISVVDDVQGELGKIGEENKPPKMSPVEMVTFGTVKQNPATEEGLTDEQ
jgi:SPP1 family phage portal protein